MRWFGRPVPLIHFTTVVTSGGGNAPRGMVLHPVAALYLKRFLHANRYPLRSKTLLNYQERMIPPPTGDTLKAAAGLKLGLIVRQGMP